MFHFFDITRDERNFELYKSTAISQPKDLEVVAFNNPYYLPLAFLIEERRELMNKCLCNCRQFGSDALGLKFLFMMHKFSREC